MSTALKKYSEKDLQDARKGGFRRKKPKKGKLKTMTAAKGYVTRWNRYVDAMKEAAKKYRKKEAEKKQFTSLKDKIRNHR